MKTATLLLLALIAASSPRAFAADPVPIQLPGADGRRTVTAVEIRGAITMDGALDEEAWRAAEPATGFVQAEPHEGEPATERTDVRLVFDRDAIYIGVACRNAAPGGAIVNDIRKDFTPEIGRAHV